MDAEEAMIAKLKNACGYEFTSKFQRMFTDIGLSRELTNEFTSYCENQRENLDLGFQIQAGAWPLTASHLIGLAVPRELTKSVQLFEKFYNNRYTGRKLTWLYHWATADIRLNYLSRLYTVTVTVPQMTILLYFNENRDFCTIDELKDTTQLVDDFLFKNVKSLIDCSILTLSDPGELSLSSKVHLNMQFVSKRQKFKISAPVVQRQTEKEVEHVNTTVQQDRKYFLECTIVRIMKTRKVCKHNQLVQDVINQSRARFSPEISFMKKVIEQLIDKQYLQRTDNADEYAYLA
uniref:Cullin family profile domain-containing protein n=1 Tax=Romanomermis culicivorax TaxID=13658 RepID=A0A915JB78_ROMCU